MNPNEESHLLKSDSLKNDKSLESVNSKLSSEDTFSPDYELLSKKSKFKFVYLILILVLLGIISFGLIFLGIINF